MNLEATMTASNIASTGTLPEWFLVVAEFWRIVLEPLLKPFLNKPDLSVKAYDSDCFTDGGNVELGSLGRSTHCARLHSESYR